LARARWQPAPSPIGRGLAATARADNGDKFALGNREINSRKRANRISPSVELLRDALDNDLRFV